MKSFTTNYDSNMRQYRQNSHSKYDLKVHLIWIPKYRKRVLVGQIAERVRDVLRKVCIEHEVHIISGKVSADHVHMFVSYKSQLAVKSARPAFERNEL